MSYKGVLVYAYQSKDSKKKTLKIFFLNTLLFFNHKKKVVSYAFYLKQGKNILQADKNKNIKK